MKMKKEETQNIEQAKSFLDALSGKPNARFTFQTYDDSEERRKSNLVRKSLSKILHGTLDEHASELIRLNNEGAGIYVTVNETDGKGRSAKNITALRALFADNDDGNFNNINLTPTIIVISKRGQHAYFRLKAEDNLGRFKNSQKQLAQYLKSDPSVNDLPRVMRLPGFFHCKDANDLFLTTIQELNDVTYTIDDVLNAHPIIQPGKITKEEKYSPSENVVKTSSHFLKWANSLPTKSGEKNKFGGRNATVVRLIAEGLGQGLAHEQLQPVVHEYVERCKAEHPSETVFEISEAEEILNRFSEQHKQTPFQPYLSDEPSLYSVSEGRIYHNKRTRHGIVPTPLCNFSAKIISEEVHDDGVEQKHFFTIEGKLEDGRVLPQIRVPSQRFASLNWVNEEWGVSAVVYAGSSIKDNLRVAIQELSGRVQKTHVFTHIGFRKVGDEYVFLHSGGAIGSKGSMAEVQVHPFDGRIQDYNLPEPPSAENLKKAIQASLSILRVAPKKITVPLLAGIFRAPLGEINRIDFSLFAVGPSGVFKSELTALCQAHYGAKFNGRNLPGNWASTSNTLERQSFLAKDSIFTVDDFAPSGTTADIARLHREAERLLRGQGNNSGRGRMRADGSLRAPNYPRGLIVSSGEDLPRGYSLRARTLTIEIGPGDVDVEQLTQSQSDAEQGLLASTMSAYLQWLASKIGEFKKVLPQRQRELRTKATNNALHRRTPDLVASLYLGWETLIQFFHESACISDQEKEIFLTDGWKHLGQAAEAQSEFHQTENPVTKFLDLVKASLISGRAYLADARTGGKPEDAKHWGWQENEFSSQPFGTKIGWVEGDEIYLLPEASFSVVQKFAREQDDSIPITANTLWKRLGQGELLKRSSSEERNTVKRTVEGKRVRVLVIDQKHLVNDVPVDGASGAIRTEKLNPSNRRKFHDVSPPLMPPKIDLIKNEGQITGPNIEQKNGGNDFALLAPVVPNAGGKES